MVIGHGMCRMWHRDPRPMLRSATLDEAGPQRFVRKTIEVLCDDGEWRSAVLEAWHQGVLGLECLISWRGYPTREYTGWYGYRKGSVRPRPDVGEPGSRAP
jgi:hypothetical protein